MDLPPFPFYARKTGGFVPDSDSATCYAVKVKDERNAEGLVRGGLRWWLNAESCISFLKSGVWELCDPEGKNPYTYTVEGYYATKVLKEPAPFKIDGPGEYKTRDGRTRTVLGRTADVDPGSPWKHSHPWAYQGWHGPDDIVTVRDDGTMCLREGDKDEIDLVSKVVKPVAMKVVDDWADSLRYSIPQWIYYTKPSPFYVDWAAFDANRYFDYKALTKMLSPGLGDALPRTATECSAADQELKAARAEIEKLKKEVLEQDGDYRVLNNLYSASCKEAGDLKAKLDEVNKHDHLVTNESATLRQKVEELKRELRWQQDLIADQGAKLKALREEKYNSRLFSVQVPIREAFGEKYVKVKDLEDISVQVRPS